MAIHLITPKSTVALVMDEEDGKFLKQLFGAMNGTNSRIHQIWIQLDKMYPNTGQEGVHLIDLKNTPFYT